MHATLLQDIGLCVIAATALAFIARLLRQPLILAYIGAGLIIGPPGFKWVHDGQSIGQISELGLAFLLFIVGLEIDLKHLIRSGKISAIVGTGARSWAARSWAGARRWPWVSAGCRRPIWASRRRSARR
jgi:Kef-type K+ transport system membrane component KefB